MHTDAQIIAKRLVESRVRIHDLVCPSGPGVYANFLCEAGALGHFSPRAERPIYIGMSSDLAARELDQHFSARRTGFSTLRRSLGAILKSEFDLTAFPRSPGSSKTNVRNFRLPPGQVHHFDNLDADIPQKHHHCLRLHKPRIR